MAHEFDQFQKGKPSNERPTKGLTPKFSSKSHPKGLPLSIFTLGGLSSLETHVQREGIVPDCQIRSPFGLFIKEARTTRAPVRVENDLAREELHSSIREFYNLTPLNEDPEQFFQKQMTKANKQIGRIVDTYFPNRRDLKGVDEAINPRDMLTVTHQLLSPQTSPRLKHELRIRLGLALLEARIDHATRGGRERLTEIQDLFNKKLFTHEGEETSVYAIHYNDTNNVHESTSKTHPAPVDYISSVYRYGLPMHRLPENTHVKEHIYWKRKVKSPLGEEFNVHLHSRTKETISSKALRKTMQKVPRGGSDLIDPVHEVRDVYGMQFVVLEQLAAEPDNNKNKVSILMEQVKQVVKVQYGKDVTFTTKDQVAGEMFQGDVRGKRLMVTFTDNEQSPTEIEMWFHGIEDDISNKYNVGTINPRTGKPENYSAHEVMEIGRGLLTAQLLFPSSIYRHIDWPTVEKNAYERVMDELKKERLDPEEALATFRRIQLERMRNIYRYY